MKRLLKTIFIISILAMVMLPSILSAQLTTTKSDHDKKNNVVNSSNSDEKTHPQRPVLTIKPREIDFGDIRPGEGAKGSFTLKNVGAGSLQWTTTGPLGWSSFEKQNLSGELKQNEIDIDIHLSYLDINMQGSLPHNLQLIMESVNKRVMYHKEVAVGTYRVSIPINSSSGPRTIFFRFKVVNGKSEPAIQVEPLRVDFGVLDMGEKATKRLQLNNKGSEPLKWHIDMLKKTESHSSASIKRGRYISFLNDDTKGKGIYEPPIAIKDNFDMTGSWTENAGYPEAGAGGSIKYRFSGSGITILFWKGPGGGKLLAYIDDKLMNEIECTSDQHERSEALIAEGMMDMPHVLKLVNLDGRTTVEGASIYGREIKTSLPGMISIFPNSGVTTKETDYINISVNTERLVPGWYGDDFIVQSTGGDVAVELSFEISADDVPKILDVYRYKKNHDYLFTTNPQAEAKHLEMAGFRKEGIAFRLFKTGTPGTVNFYRWFNAKKGDHFYTYDAAGSRKSLNGYIYEGVIGNIATSRLTNTRGLYRWYHSTKGTHFYTTDQSGEGLGKKGYHFEAIAGYVR
jgi:hypothetical protein